MGGCAGVFQHEAPSTTVLMESINQGNGRMTRASMNDAPVEKGETEQVERDAGFIPCLHDDLHSNTKTRDLTVREQAGCSSCTHKRAHGSAGCGQRACAARSCELGCEVQAGQQGPRLVQVGPDLLTDLQTQVGHRTLAWRWSPTFQMCHRTLCIQAWRWSPTLRADGPEAGRQPRRRCREPAGSPPSRGRVWPAAGPPGRLPPWKPHPAQAVAHDTGDHHGLARLMSRHVWGCWEYCRRLQSDPGVSHSTRALLTDDGLLHATLLLPYSLHPGRGAS